MLTRRRTATVAVAVAALCWCGAASAGLADQSALAKRFAPVVRIVTQAKECGPGEPYLPLDVNVLFGADTVSLRGPWNRTDLISIAPTATQVGKGLYGYHLDFPGDALTPGCTYEQWARTISAGTKPTVYAHVVTQAGRPGKLALQYWLFYAFNDWNNFHEGDWEMIQLLFDASTPAAALDQRPVEVGYSQHEGAERASWDDSKLELVDGTHPVVHVAAGSHANFFGEALYLGSAASEGVGCDDTRGPTSDIRPVVRTIPTDPDRGTCRVSLDRVRGSVGRAPAGVLQRSDWPEPEAAMDPAAPVGGGLAQPELRSSSRRRAGDPGNRFLLRRCRRRLRAPAATRARAARRPPRARCAHRALGVRALACHLATDRAAPPGTSSGLGSDHCRGRTHVPPADVALRGNRAPLRTDRTAHRRSCRRS